MTTLRASARAVPARGARTRPAIGGVLVPAGTVLALLALAVLAMLPPFVLHPLLDAAGSALILGVSTTEAHLLSDATVSELVLGPGQFVINGPDGAPLYGAAEIGHLRDARLLLYLFLGLATVSAVGVAVSLARARGAARRTAWRRISRAGALLSVTVVLLGVVALVAFEPAFELFHRIFFPGGNFNFDPASQRLVQLYPLLFWQLVSGAIGLLAGGLGLLTWRLGRRRA